MTKYLVLLLISTLAAIFVPAYRWWLLPESEMLLRLLPGQFRDLKAYITDTEDTRAAFWSASEGMKGIAERLGRMVTVVRFLQNEFHSGHISASEALYVWASVAEQVWFSILAAPEAVICLVWCRLPHAAGLFALRSYYGVVVRTLTVCGTEDRSIELMHLL